ncbi:MAG: hypothetical protein Q4A08_09325, partial [Bacteroidales bacterium]|nr:hypothetical protein [Bacteroidales bacterium]
DIQTDSSERTKQTEIVQKKRKSSNKKMSSAIKFSAYSEKQRSYNIFGHQLVNMYIIPKLYVWE